MHFEEKIKGWSRNFGDYSLKALSSEIQPPEPTTTIENSADFIISDQSWENLPGDFWEFLKLWIFKLQLEPNYNPGAYNNLYL